MPFTVVVIQQAVQVGDGDARFDIERIVHVLRRCRAGQRLVEGGRIRVPCELRLEQIRQEMLEAAREQRRVDDEAGVDA